jgi:hypothetical protein
VRRLLAIALLSVLVLAGCGSASSSSPSASTIRSTELSYFPSGSPFVMSVATDPSSTAVKQGNALVARFPLATFGEGALIAKLRQYGIDYQSDLRPLLGNPVMLGAAAPTLTGLGSNAFLAVWVAKDAGKLSALLKKLPGLHSTGSHGGATLYQESAGTTVAVSGATLVLGASADEVGSALNRHASGSGISSTAFSAAFAGLPQNGLMQMFGSLSGVLSSASSAKSRRVPWVAALRGYAASVTASASGLSFQYRLDTSGGALTPAQLPVAAGTTAPSLAGSLPITVGIKDPAQIFTFAENAEQLSSPAGYAAFQKRQAAVRAKTGVDLTSLVKLLTGDLALTSDTHTTMGRVATSDPAAAARVLAKLMTAPRSVFNKATVVTKLGGGFYALKEPKQTITVGVTGGQLVAGKASVADLSAFAGAPATPAPGAKGSVAFRVALSDLLHVALKKAPPQIVQTILSQLGNITGWTAASPSALTGTATLAFK